MAAMDSNFFGLGSGSDKTITSLSELRSQLQRDFAQCGDLSMGFEPIKMDREGSVAWCAGDCTISAKMDDEMLRLDGRMSTVLRKSGDQWLFAHIHFSVLDRG